MLVPVPRANNEIATWDEALRYVRARSTDLRIAADLVVSAEAQQRVALAGTLPTINGLGVYTHNFYTNPVQQTVAVGPGGATESRVTNFPSKDPLTGQVVGVQPVLALRAWNAIGTARVFTDAARLSFDDVKRQLSLSVANSIVGVVTAERIAELNRVALRDALALEKLTERMTALGGGTGMDVVRAQQYVEVTRATLVVGDEALRQSREFLGLVLGVAGAIGVPPTIDISGLERDTRAACRPAATVDERADVAALRARVEVAHRLVNDVKYQFAPTVNVQSAISTLTENTTSLPSTIWNVQAVLSVPIWDGGARYGFLRDAHAQEDIAAMNLEATRRAAAVQITQAQRGVTVAEDNRRVAGRARDLAAQLDHMTRRAYQEGRGTSLELTIAAQALSTADIQLAIRDFALVNARIFALLTLASCPW
jgi:multidrug efflux system outer membrane protein